MKKTMLLSFLLSIIAHSSYSQNHLSWKVKKLSPEAASQNTTPQKKKPLSNKKLGDTLYYQPFDSLSGWKITNVNSDSNSYAWRWDTTSGVSGIPPLKSSTGSGGFLNLPMGFYNAPSDSTEMHTFVSSPAIVISPARKSLIIEFQQYINHCCNSDNKQTIEVSTDSIHWKSYPVLNGLAINTPNIDTSENAPVYAINISEVAAMADTLYLRILDSGDIGHSWMLDDITLLEGPQHDLTLSNVEIQFNNDDYSIQPFYHQIPLEYFNPKSFSAQIRNEGSDSSSNSRLKVSVEKTLDRFGNPSSGLFYEDSVYSSNQGLLPPFPAMENLSIDTQVFRLPFIGTYTVNFAALMDSTDQDPTQEFISRQIKVTDTIFARDDGNFSASTGPQSFLGANGVAGGSDFDAMGTLYNFEGRLGSCYGYNTFSITYYVSNDSNNIGVGLIPTIWKFNEDSSTIARSWDHLNNVVADGRVYTVTASDTATFLTLPISLVAPFNRLDSGQYIVGWETVSGGRPWGNKYFEVGNDRSTASYQPFGSTFIYHEHDVVSPYGIVDAQPVIRLNHGCFSMASVEDEENKGLQSLKIYPIPTNDLLTIDLFNKSETSYLLTIRNVSGQQLYQETLIAEGLLKYKMDISFLPKGIYFLQAQLTNGEVISKKVIKQ